MKLSTYWRVFPTLKEELLDSFGRDGYLKLKVGKDCIRKSIYGNSEFVDYAKKVEGAFKVWKDSQWTKLNGINKGDNPKTFIIEISSALLQKFSDISLIDKYDVYQCLMSYWEETMQDDVYAIAFDGWEAGNGIEREMVKKKDGTTTGKMKSYEGRIIPKKLIIEKYFPEEQRAINRFENERDEVNRLMDELKEEHGGDEGLLCEVINDKGNITKGDLQKRINEIERDKELADEVKVLQQYEKLMASEATYNTAIKNVVVALEKAVFDKYDDLSIDEIKELVVEKKWCYTIFDAVDSIYSAISHRLANRITELVERYEETLPHVAEEVAVYEVKVKTHLERMGFTWN